jgi:hypothetical protein
VLAKTQFMKFILTCLAYLACLTTSAKDYEGYIIKNARDTIEGSVDVNYKNIKINGEQQPAFPEMWTDISFTEKGGKNAKLKAGDISGYGFKMDGKWYHFEVLDYEKNYNVKIPKMLKSRLNDMRFFLHRVHDGAMPVYREYWDWPLVSQNDARNSALVFEWEIGRQIIECELWTKDQSGQLHELIPSTGKAKKLKGFLEVLKLESEFLKSLTDKDSFNNAEQVLVRYNEWRKSQ